VVHVPLLDVKSETGTTVERADGRAAMTRDDRANQESAREAADRLALALEDAGFDVGQEFPALHDAVGRQGVVVVRIGDIRPAVAERLAALLMSEAGLQAKRAKGDDAPQ